MLYNIIYSTCVCKHVLHVCSLYRNGLLYLLQPLGLVGDTRRQHGENVGPLIHLNAQTITVVLQSAPRLVKLV